MSRSYFTRINPLLTGMVFIAAAFASLPANAADQPQAGTENFLSLAEAEQAVLRSDPQVAAALARARAFSEQSVASGQLMDPKLQLALGNVPIDDLDLRKNPMTQLRVGVMQAFPRGDTLRYKALRDEWLSNAENAMAEVRARMLLRDVREIWLEIWYQQTAQQVIRENRDLFQQLVTITEGQYGSGRALQQDVLRAELELSRLDDMLINARKAEAGFRGRLTRWLGEKARLPLPAALPRLPAPADLEALEKELVEHPALKQKSAQLQAQEQAVEIAREQYKPGWSIGGEYRQRFGNDPDGRDRDNMIAVMASIDLPFFTRQRQDRTLAAAQEKADAVWFARQDTLDSLRAEYYWRIADEEELRRRLKLYQDFLVRDAKANAEASLQAYQAGVTEFTTLMRARITELDVQLQALRVQVDLLKNHARLQYLSQQPVEYSSRNESQSERVRDPAASGE